MALQPLHLMGIGQAQHQLLVLVAEAATQRAVKAAESLSADLVEVANSGAAKVSLELRVLTVRPPVVAR